MRRRLDILDPSKEDVVPAKQLFQLQPLLDLLSQDLENVGRSCGAGSHIPRSKWCHNKHGLERRGTHLVSGRCAYTYIMMMNLQLCLKIISNCAELVQKYVHWNIEKAFGILYFGYCPIKVVPSGESSWSTLPWFVQVL